MILKRQMPKTDEEWKQKMDTQKYHVMREKGTEIPFTGKLLKNKEKGKYVCGACGVELFDSETKFDSGTGWPSFDNANTENVELREDNSHGMRRMEVICKRCGGHLGHLFDDGPTKTGKRFCINSCALDFKSNI